jgi:lauroyl/myristoyl acyltransferase
MNNFVHHYHEELQHCRRQFENLDLRKEKGYLFKFTTFSANLRNILPEIPTDKHEGLFQELLLQQIYSNFDQQFLTANDLVRTEGNLKELINSGRPNIFCTFHLGSYRLLTSYLYRHGVDIALLVGSNAFHQQKASFLKTINGLREKHKLTNTFEVLDAEHPSSTLQVIRQLRAGTSLVIFIDGLTSNTGVNRSEDKEMRVHFGNSRLWARKGVGFLSHVTQVPIVPVISHREKNLDNVLSFLDPITPDNFPDRESYCQHSLQQLYSSFWKHLVRYPAQWEGWLYVQNFIDHHDLAHQVNKEQRIRPQKPQKVVFNHDRFTICDLEEAPVLYDRRLYLTYEISTDLRDFLIQIGKIDVPEDVLGTDLYLDLLAKEIII